jgi:CTP-dependent riboflavin kinase
LTAAPFENSSGEIYNMLSYVAREKLKEAGIENYHEFLTQFIALKSELSVNSKGKATDKNVVKGFKNCGALQSLLNQYVMKINGEDAGIVRPDKTDHIVELNPTTEQRDVTKWIREYVESCPEPKEDPVAMLRCLNTLRHATLSPL